MVKPDSESSMGYLTAIEKLHVGKQIIRGMGRPCLNQSLSALFQESLTWMAEELFQGFISGVYVPKLNTLFYCIVQPETAFLVYSLNSRYQICYKNSNNYFK